MLVFSYFENHEEPNPDWIDRHLLYSSLYDLIWLQYRKQIVKKVETFGDIMDLSDQIANKQKTKTKKNQLNKKSQRSKCSHTHAHLEIFEWKFLMSLMNAHRLSPRMMADNWTVFLW